MELSSISRLILDLLSETSPEYGARLKQRLNSALVKQGHEHFSERTYGFSRFRDFLQKSLSGSISIERPSGSGDILVHLVKKPAMTVSSGPTAVSEILPVIRSDVWQAFIQPDLSRKRYLRKSTGQLLHFLEGANTAIATEVNDAKQDFAEIIPVKPEVQLAWMRDYLTSTSVSASAKEAIRPLLSAAYSSMLNATFTRALGDQGAEWRAHRTHLVHRRIDEWCKLNGVPIERLAAATKTESLAPPAIPGANDSPRAQAIRLLETLSEDDISRIILPMLATTMFVKARMAS